MSRAIAGSASELSPETSAPASIGSGAESRSLLHVRSKCWRLCVRCNQQAPPTSLARACASVRFSCAKTGLSCVDLRAAERVGRLSDVRFTARGSRQVQRPQLVRGLLPVILERGDQLRRLRRRTGVRVSALRGLSGHGLSALPVATGVEQRGLSALLRPNRERPHPPLAARAQS